MGVPLRAIGRFAYIYTLGIEIPNPVSHLKVVHPPTPHDLQSIRSRAPWPISCHFAVFWLLEMLDVAGLQGSPDEGLMACSSNHTNHNHNHNHTLSPCDLNHLRVPSILLFRPTRLLYQDPRYDITPSRSGMWNGKGAAPSCGPSTRTRTVLYTRRTYHVLAEHIHMKYGQRENKFQW
jgi:hypothetical protein